MREVFAAFDDKGTIDSLGLGVIRDAIADQVFPGVSTIQTRARYFLFVPWICQVLEREGVLPDRFPSRLRELEVDLIDALRATHGPAEGVIGYRAGRRLSRLPSSIYWNGLGVFRIRLMALSLSDYRSILPRLAHLHVHRDDDGEPVSSARRVWDAGMPAAPDHFPTVPLGFALEGGEADYLIGRIVTRCPDTLIAELARDLTIPREFPMPWEVPLPGASPRLREVLEQARNFSDLMYGAQALYNLVLARRAKKVLDYDADELVAAMEEELGEWSELVTERQHELAPWLASGALWPVTSRVTSVPMRSRRFVETWGELALNDPENVWRDPAAEDLIVQREAGLKGKLARLVEQRALENWNGEAFGRGQMTFRWENAQQILDDLEHAET